MAFFPRKPGASPSRTVPRPVLARVASWGCVSVAFLLVVAAAVAHAQSLVSEYAVKAAYLFDFGKFVRYTSSGGHNQNPTFDICILGQNPFGHTLADLTANEKLDGKPVRVLRVQTIEQARECSIAYLSASERGRMAHDLDELRGQQVLTVSDSSHFLQKGGIIQFVTVGDHVRFAVNLNAAHKAQISLSSELLKVAISVQGNQAAGVRP